MKGMIEITIDDMAKQLGVSKSTVSRALTGKGRIGEATRLKIQSYAREYGGWEEKEKETRLTRTHHIGVVIPTDAYAVNVPFFQECLLGISEMAIMLKYSVLITTGGSNDISGVQTLVENKQVDGMILLRGVENDRLLKYLTAIHFPTGLAGTCDYEEVIQVDTDNRAAAETMVSLLISQGYRRFAMVVGNISFQVNRSRCQGYYDALDKNGLDKDNQMFYPNFIHMELIDRIVSDIFAGKVECIVCGDDVICTRLMSRLQADGYRIPRDISIVSLFNSTNLDCFSPAVTAVSISARQFGKVIGNQLINYLQGESYNKKTLLGHDILLRKSVGK